MALTEYYTPTQVYFGKGAEDKVGEILKKRGAKKVLIHFGSGSVKKSGLLDKVENSLNENGIPFIELGGVVPNPRISLVREGVEIGRKENVDYVLAVGGGSAVDSAKAICYGIFDKEKGDVWDYYCQKRKAEGAIPLGVILTLSATGSEMSASSVITNEEECLKRGYNTNYARPAFALLNPELTYTVSPYQTSCGTADIMMHTLERYFHKGATLELTDRLSLALLKEVMEAGILALEEPENYDARANLMWAGSLSHNGLMQIGNDDRGDWACHQLEHELSGMFDVAHGAGLAAIWATWARYVMDENPARFVKLGVYLFDMKESGDEKADALKAIGYMENYFKEIEMPINLRELGVDPTEEEYRTLAKRASFFGKRLLGSIKTLTEEDMYNIFKAAR